MIRTFKIIFALSILAIVPGFAWGQSYNGGTLKIEAPWVRATPAGAKVAGGYMTIMNSGAEPDRLIGGTLPQAGRFEVHEMKMNGAMMQMRPLPGGLEIGPGQKVELKPSGFHIMFTDLHEPLKQGQKLKGQLRFEKAGTVDIEYQVESIGAQSPAQHSH